MMKKTLQRILFGAGLSIALNSCACDEPEILNQSQYCQQVLLDEREGIPRPADICNGFDDDCDSLRQDGSIDSRLIDENCDGDRDGFCDPDTQYQDCPTPDPVEGCQNEVTTDIVSTQRARFEQYCAQTFAQLDDGGFVRYDCNDADPSINPDAQEMCDGIDNNCIDGIDESFPEMNQPCIDTYLEPGELPWQESMDGVENCHKGYKACENYTDLDNTLRGIVVCEDFQGPMTEICDGYDNDCDTFVDNNEALAVAEQCYYEVVYNADGTSYTLTPDAEGIDAMNNGAGLCRPGFRTCEEGGLSEECYGAFVPKPEICDLQGNSEDCDCEGNEDFDQDGDQYAGDCGVFVTCEGELHDELDCNDFDNTIYPGATEIICDDIDQNCDGHDLTGEDLDEDGYTGNPACETDPDLLDCNDEDDSIHPYAPERCNCIDDDCDGEVDENLVDDSPIDIVGFFDTSGSMNPYISAVITAYSTGEILDCLKDSEKVLLSTGLVNYSLNNNTTDYDKYRLDYPSISTVPYVVRTQATGAEFQAEFPLAMLAASGGVEVSLDAMILSICADPLMASDPTCVPLMPHVMQMLLVPGSDPEDPQYRELWRDGSSKTIVYVGDEEGQTNLGYLDGIYIDQVIVQEAANAAGITMHMIVSDNHHQQYNGSYSVHYGSIPRNPITGSCQGRLISLEEVTDNNGIGLASEFSNSITASFCGDSSVGYGFDCGEE